jgi:hypothetical protein
MTNSCYETRIKLFSLNYVRYVALNDKVAYESERMWKEIRLHTRIKIVRILTISALLSTTREKPRKNKESNSTRRDSKPGPF